MAGATLNFQLPDHIAACEVKIRRLGHGSAKQFGASSRLERGFVAEVVIHALLRRGCRPQQRPERATVHHAETGVPVRLKRERVDIVTPNGCLAQ